MTPLALPHSAPPCLAEIRADRRSVKEYDAEPVDLDTVGSVLWTAASMRAGRAHASARGRYLVTTTVISGDVEGLPPGAYRYSAREHHLTLVRSGDHRAGLAEATIDAPWLTTCPLILMLSSDIERADKHFEELPPGQGERFAWLEAGLITQNVYLWTAATGLGTVFVGGLDGTAAARMASALCNEGETLLGLMPIGRPAGGAGSR